MAAKIDNNFRLNERPQPPPLAISFHRKMLPQMDARLRDHQNNDTTKYVTHFECQWE